MMDHQNLHTLAGKYRRFVRLLISVSVMLGMVGPARALPDRKVPDVYALQDLDCGDAPDSYQTLLNSNGACHALGPPLWMGQIVDGEADGQPTPLADGDDLNPPGAVDDEDGVTLLTPLVAGSPAQILVNIGGAMPGMLDAWIDFNGNSAFDHPLEHLWGGGSMPVVPGQNPLPFAVPLVVMPGMTYARFRLSAKGTPSPCGLAPDGEVEDYQVLLEGEPVPVDWGDAPDTYQTLFASNGPRHVIVAGFRLGPTIDSEVDGQPTPQADGDDLSSLPDDEDGVLLPAALVPGTVAQVTVDGGGAGGMLDAWIDFNGNTVFDDPAEHLWAGVSQPVAPGVNPPLGFSVPINAMPGRAYARFRLSANGRLAPFGLATDGEVEDYLVIMEAIDLDYGDAPDSYQTWVASNGARHLPGPDWMGPIVDLEQDGYPSPLADGDDLNPPVGVDDEDGVTLPAVLLAGDPAAQVTVDGGPMGGMLDAWIDFNGNGAFDHPAERLWGASMTLVKGPNVLAFAVPVLAAPGMTYARFRISINGGLTPVGFAPDGEVEDYTVVIEVEPEPMDYGDAPDSFKTVLLSNGARHFALQGFSLGPLLDLEVDGQPSPPADGDDLNPPVAPSDEDGVLFPTALIAGDPAAVVQVFLVNATGLPAFLDAWIDFDGSGAFDHTAEHLWGGFSQPLLPGPQPLFFAVPANSVTAPTYARFRLSTCGGLPPSGAASDGEVEDYLVKIELLTLDYAANSGGSISGVTHQTVPYGGSGTAVLAVPDTGWGFMNWTDGLTDNPRTDTNVTASLSVKADFARLLGDVNMDGLVNSTDALIVLSADAGLNTAAYCPMNYGDANLDGYVNSTDALVILTYDAGLPVGTLPVGQPVAQPVLVTQPPGCP